jgi:hypothetical protein
MIEVQRICSRLDSVTHAELTDVVSAIPRGWPVTDTELEAVGDFLERRAKPVAERLRARFGGNP